ncbi:MAG: ATP-binding cassette domain-containing protein [bacterium]
MIRLQNLTLRRGAKLLFEQGNLSIYPGQKAGLTGANGSGKSSLLAAIIGDLGVDSGDLTFPGSWVIAHVAQETPALDRSAIDYVLDGDKELRKIHQQLAEAEQTEQHHQIAALHEKLDSINAYTAEFRGRRLLHGLGFDTAQQDQNVANFSGGWRMRLNLAQALMCRSDLLLLDEPTNHLDLDAVIWLEGWLKSYQGTLIMIAHDRDFLDQVCGHILHVENQQIKLYTGNYSDFEKQRAESMAQEQAMHRKQQAQMAHMQAYVDRFRAKASKAKQAQSRLKAISRLGEIALAHVNDPFHFSFLQPEKVPDLLINTPGFEAGYNGKTILKSNGMELRAGARIGLLGRNGAGKSTLIKTLAGELELVDGEYIPHKYLKIGYFAQHQMEFLQADQTPLQHAMIQSKGISEQQLRDHLGGYGFHGDKALEPVGHFSGGEKARLVLALIALERPNLLMLDEPTNHLDLDMRHALSVALQEYEGVVILVSHDRHLLDMVCDQFWLIHNGELKPFDDSLHAYERLLTQKNDDSNKSTVLADNKPANNKKEQRKQRAVQRQQQSQIRNQVKKIERNIEKLQAEKTQLENTMADPNLYNTSSTSELKELSQKQRAIVVELEKNEERWLELQEKLEEQ